jgi:hypothetical protein
MNMNIIRKILVITAVVTSGLTVLPAVATPNPNVTLMATVDRSPAFSYVRWSLFRVENGVRESEPYRVYDNRHSLAIRLPPGRYVAEASRDSVSRTRTFDVGNAAPNNIVVALD